MTEHLGIIELDGHGNLAPESVLTVEGKRYAIPSWTDTGGPGRGHRLCAAVEASPYELAADTFPDSMTETPDELTIRLVPGERENPGRVRW